MVLGSWMDILSLSDRMLTPAFLPPNPFPHSPFHLPYFLPFPASGSFPFSYPPLSLFPPPPLSITTPSLLLASSLPTPRPMSLSLVTELHPAQPVAAHPFHPRAERRHGQELLVDAEP